MVTLKTLVFAIVAMLSVQTLLAADEETKEPKRTRTEVTYFEIRQLIDEGGVESASVTGDGWWVNVTTNDGNKHYAQITPQTPIADYLYGAGIPVKIIHWNEKEDETPLWLKMFFNILPLLIFLVFFGFILFLMRGVNRKARKKYDEYLERNDRINSEHLDRLEILHREFLSRLEKVISEDKQK